jgi:HK97 gp10 family phage protein
MAGKRRSSVKGAAKMRRTLRQLPNGITGEIADELEAVANRILGDMLAAVPVRTGDLKSKLRVQVHRERLIARIGTFGGKTQRSYHAHLVEFGTARGNRTAPGGGTYMHPGSPAQPFMLPAYKKNKQDGLTRIRRATLRALEKARGFGGPL